MKLQSSTPTQKAVRQSAQPSAKDAAKHKPDALVLMKEQKSALVRFFLGSVTEYCANHSAVPVKVVPL